MQRISENELRQIFQEQGAALTLYARQWCISPEDALQEALIELAGAQPPPHSPIAWLFKTVRRRAMNQARSDRRREKHHRTASQQHETWFTIDEPADLDVHKIQSLLAQLPPLEREIVVARIWGNLTLSEIAELVESSTSTVHRQYQQALASLAHEINRNEKRETPS